MIKTRTEGKCALHRGVIEGFLRIIVNLKVGLKEEVKRNDT